MPDREHTTTQTQQAIYQGVSESERPVTLYQIAERIEEDVNLELMAMVDEMVDGEYLTCSTNQEGHPIYSVGARSPWR